MIEQNTTINMIEQLWYTWSDVGLSTIRAGFRIRAASAGLHDIRSSRVQKLDRYQRYALPRGLDDLAIPTSIAPACLSLISTGEEHILVQKVYTGKDAVGRDGAFFVHLLAGLPENFSAQDAIALWKSPFWQVSDVQLRREETLLDRVSLEDLLRQRREITPGSRNLANIQSYLPYIIQVYLTKKLSIEPKTGQSVSQKLYIAAPDEDIALLISGLTQCLPTRILKDLTFSTYEPNVAVATTEIVGTCWLSTPVDDKMPYVERLLPAHYLQEKLAINCYTGVCSRLMDNPLLETRPLAGKFALDATKYFVRRCTERFAEKFTLLLELSADLTVDEFLEIYESLILKDEDSIKLLLSSSDYAHVARMLARPAYQQELIVFAISNPAWWRDTGKSAVTRLQKASYAIPVLQQALLDIAQLAINRAVVIVRGEDDLASELFRTGWWITEEEILQTIIDVLDCTTPSYQVPEIWNSLLQELLKIVDNFACLTQYWKIYARLMKIWSTTLPSSMKGLEQIEPLLAISWEQFGAFLALRLPFSWTEEATKNLISAGVPELDTENANELAHNYHPLVADLLQRFAQNVGLWSLAEALFKRLAEGQYARRLDLLYILLDSAMGEQDDIVMQLLSAVQLTEIADQVHFLEHYAQRYLVRYPDSPVLSEYIRAFLAYLPTAGGDIFIGNTPSPTEQFLQLLTGWFFRHALPSDSADRYTAEIFAEFIDWYTVGILLRQPSLLQLEKLVVANCIGRVLSIPHISLKMRIPIIANLAVACVENERGLAAMIATMRQALRPTDLMDLLDQVARTVRQNIVAQRYPKARFWECLQFAILFKSAFQAEDEQEYFLQNFLDTLLLNANGSTLVWLAAPSRNLSVPTYAEWRKYLSRHPELAAIIEASFFEHIGLWWERMIAFTQMWIALQTRHFKTIAQVAMKYMTIFMSYDTPQMDSWWTEIDNMTNRLNAYEAQSWEQGKSLSPVRHSSSIWKYILAFIFTWLALRSKRIGSIATVATDHMLTLELCQVDVPLRWWIQIDAAFDFFIACEDAYQDSNQDRENAIIDAGKRIEHLTREGYSTPRLSLHEKRRLKVAYYHRDKHIPGSLRAWTPHTLRPLDPQNTAKDSSSSGEGQKEV